jgi:putative DNA primase/helicase
MSKQTADEIFRKHGIVGPTAPGQFQTICPQCSHARKAGHQKLKCLGVKVDDLGVQWHCNHCEWSGGEFFERRSSSSGFVAEYIYRQPDGTPFLRVCKRADKQFPQFHWDVNQWVAGKPKGPKIPYRLPEVVAAGTETTVYICEGEKDADSLAHIGLVATSASEGAGKWKSDLNQWFKDRRVVILVDADAPGRAHGQQVAKQLHRVAASVKVVDLYPERIDGSDVSDWLAKDSVGVKLLAAVKDAPEWDPESAKDSSSTDDAVIAELAALPPLDYAKRRKAAAERLGIRVPELDELVKAARGSSAAPPLFPHWQVEPSSAPVNAERLLTRLLDRIRSHVVMTDHAARTVALWVAMTWVHEEAAVHSPILLVTSPEANSGKTTLLGVISFLVRRSLRTAGATAAALYRAVEKWEPTILVDEADTAFVDNDDLRRVVNSGWTRGDGVLVCDGDTHDPRVFSTFCPKALGMKGRKLPDTTLSRTIVIEMARRKPGERALDFQYVDDDGLAELRSNLVRFAADSAEALRRANPTRPEGFENRDAANWRLMLAVADTAGEEWGRNAREAAKTIAGATPTESAGINLLADIKTMFESEDNPDCITSRKLVELLTTDPESRWCEWGRKRKPITQNRLAGLLREFRIISATVHPDGQPDAKGYRRVDFEEAWTRYLPAKTPSSEPSPLFEASKRPNADGMGTSCGFQSVREDPSGRFENGNLSYSHAGLDAWTDRKGGNGDASPSDHGIEPSSAPESPPWEEPQIRTSPEDRHPAEERTSPPPPPKAPAPDPWAGLDIPLFLRRSNDADRAPALGPPGDSLDDFKW